MTHNFDVSLNKLHFDIFLHPKKYSTPLPIEEIVADTKVDPKGVKWYKERLTAGEQIRPIVVVKHPQKNLFAVVDGHHRFFAHIECRKTHIDCAVIHDFTGFLFNLTKDGWLQPHPTFTKQVRAPILEFHQQLDQRINRELRQNMKQFLIDFHVHPDTLIGRFRKLVKND